MAPSSAVTMMIVIGGKMRLTEVKKLSPNSMVNSRLDRSWQNLFHSQMKLTSLVVLSSCLALSQAAAKIDLTVEFVLVHEKKDPAEASAGRKKPPAPAAAGAAAAPKPIDQAKSITITLHNASSKPEAGVLVRYWLIGRDMKTMRNALLDGGESTADLKPSASIVITSEPIKSTYTQKQVFSPAPAAAGGAKGSQPAAATAKPVKAGGTKISGYAVQVINKEGKIVAESFLEPGYKQLIGSDGNNPGPLFKKPEAAPAP